MKNDILQRLTLDEKVALVSGTEFWKTNPIPRLKIPNIYMTDGPCGLRKQGEKADHLGINASEPTTSFPTSATQASSWNPENTRKMGKAIAEECKYFGVNMILGPGINIKRNPKCGRNFEYFSEDPLISAEFGQAFIDSVQENGIGTSLKHFAANSNEKFRYMGDSVVDERALREIYLRAFEKVVKKSHPTTVMSAYNKVNGVFCASNRKLLTDILRKEWGFKGAVISDWGGVNDRLASIQAGLDLEMPGDCLHFRKQLLDAVQSGELSEEDLDASVARVLDLVSKTTLSNSEVHQEFDCEAHHKISVDIAVDSAVLMKNSNILPLDPNGKYLVLGELFDKMRFQGSGSSLINPTKIVTPLQAFEKRGINFEYYRAYDCSECSNEDDLLRTAIEKASQYDTILIFIGQTDFSESEGYDRDDMKLPANQLRFVSKLLSLGKKVVTVLYGGSPIEMDLINKTDAILNMYLPGQGGGEATARLLFGEANPSGKLAETWMNTYTDVPFGENFVSQERELYKESIFVGYRYYDALNDNRVAYPFGHGLSYTNFSFNDLDVVQNKNNIEVTLTVSNTGRVKGAEVVQIYVSNPQTTVFKPIKELRAFKKVYLDAGESKTITLTIDKNDLAYYNPLAKQWVIENGDYTIHVARSSKDIVISQDVALTGYPQVRSPYSPENLPSYYDVNLLSQVSDAEYSRLLGKKVSSAVLKNEKRKLTLNTPISEFNHSFFGRKFYQSVVGVGEKQYKKGLAMPEGPERDMNLKNGHFITNMMPNNSLRSMAVSSAGQFSFNMAEGILEMVNGHPIKGIKLMKKKYTLPELPKNSIQSK